MNNNSIILQGDSLIVLKDLPDNSVDAIVTDPPYGLKFMGKKWDYDVPSKALWEEVLRVLKPGGHLLSFGGTRTYHRMVVAIEDAGFEIRDQIQWLYGSGFPKSMNVGKKVPDFQGWGTALKPANEPIVLARKPLSEKTVAKNVEKWGTGALNIDGTRIGSEERTQLSGKASNANCFGEYGKGEMQTVQGRWPANILFDDTAAEMLDEQSGMLKSGELKGYNIPGASANGHLQDKATRLIEKSTANAGGASRFFYVAKASKRERNAGLENEVKQKQDARPNSADSSGKFPDHDHRPSGGNNHPTVKPIKLMEYLIKLVTPPNGTVLDPFCGSGSTGVAAISLGFKFIGIEREAEYVKIAEKRII